MIENIRHTSSFPPSLLPLRTFVLAENEGEITENRESREIREIEELDTMYFLDRFHELVLMYWCPYGVGGARGTVQQSHFS